MGKKQTSRINHTKDKTGEMKKKVERIGTYHIGLDADVTQLDDYRNSNFTLLQVPFFEGLAPVQLVQDVWLGKGGIFWDGVCCASAIFARNTS